jgi:hypothetical protein
VTDDTNYPQTISISIDGVDRTAALGGAWAATNAAVNVKVDITDYIVNASGGMYQEHSIVFTCTAGQGKIRVMTEKLTTVQAIAVAI